MVPDDDKPAPPSLDPKVKELLERDQGKSLHEIVDEKTAAELQRWFGLPSFEKLEEEGVAPEELSPEDAADQAKRDETLAAVADWMMEGLGYRHDRAWDLIVFKPNIDVRLDLDMPLFDQAGLSRISVNSEVREIQRPEYLEDQLKEQTPQALLRDLHRSVESFDKLFEVHTEVAAELVVNPSLECRTAMATSWKLPNLGDPPGVVIRRIFAQLHADIHIPWADLPNRVEMTNRRVTE